MRSASQLNWKTVLIGTWISVCIITSLIFTVRNPSKQESEAKLVEMTADMDYALREGGTVDSRYSNAKIGGALLYVNVLKNSWNRELADKYKTALLGRGWVETNTEEGGLALCKNKILATIRSSPELDSSRGLPREVYGFSMKYGGYAARVCK